jgi:hypothetical protein
MMKEEKNEYKNDVYKEKKEEEIKKKYVWEIYIYIYTSL